MNIQIINGDTLTDSKENANEPFTAGGRDFLYHRDGDILDPCHHWVSTWRAFDGKGGRYEFVATLDFVDWNGRDGYVGMVKCNGEALKLRGVMGKSVKRGNRRAVAQLLTRTAKRFIENKRKA